MLGETRDCEHQESCIDLCLDAARSFVPRVYAVIFDALLSLLDPHLATVLD